MTDPQPSLIIHVPPGFTAAKSYAIDVVFNRILQVRYEQRASTAAHYRLDVGNQQIVLADVLLKHTADALFVTDLTPTHALASFPIPAALHDAGDGPATVPVLFGEPNLRTGENGIECDIDIFGSVFFMLSRYEELTSPVRDTHERFPAAASLAAKEGFLDRPIVNEYAMLLWGMIKSLRPSSSRPYKAGQFRITCDVDHPFDPIRSQLKLAGRSAAADIVKRRSVASGLRRIGGFLSHTLGRHDGDPNYTFDWYARVCADANKSATFYFIPDHTAGTLDGYYDLYDRRVIQLIRYLANEGHSIGTHGSYHSFRNALQIRNERQRMQAACQKAAITSDVAGNRQHYLRWDARETADHLDAAGYEYDSTGGYADAPGFRFGTAHAFPMWSWQKNAPLGLIQRPLILMDTTLLSTEYLGLETPGQMLRLAQKLAARTLSSGGDFTILWHNSNLKTADTRQLFQSIIH